MTSHPLVCSGGFNRDWPKGRSSELSLKQVPNRDPQLPKYLPKGLRTCGRATGAYYEDDDDDGDDHARTMTMTMAMVRVARTTWTMMVLLLITSHGVASAIPAGLLSRQHVHGQVHVNLHVRTSVDIHVHIGTCTRTHAHVWKVRYVSCVSVCFDEPADVHMLHVCVRVSIHFSRRSTFLALACACYDDVLVVVIIIILIFGVSTMIMVTIMVIIPIMIIILRTETMPR